MTTIQAIDLLKGLEQSLDDYCELNNEGKTAFRMAITALEVFGLSEQLPAAQQEQRWIPCSERLPEEAGTYLCTCVNAERWMVTLIKWQPRMRSWNLTGARAYWKVVAWKPLPEPYKEGEQDD